MPKGQVPGTESYYTGYSKECLPYRKKLSSGQVKDVQKMMVEKEDEIRKSAKTHSEMMAQFRLVDWMERASLSLQVGDADKTLEYCRFGQELIEGRESESYGSEAVSSIGSFFTDIVGAGEYGRYDAPGYEKVLLLDLASMAYLLKGDDRAFNVARLAIQWQDEEKERFEKELEEIIKEEREKQTKDKEETPKTAGRLDAALNYEFSKYEDVALTVPNAFVNPFGDYVTGMINEFKSVKLKSLVSNAHIAYQQALKLNPESKVLQQAVRDTKKRKSAGCLIHVVALDGFVPEKKVLSIPIDRDLDVELPSYNPYKSKVSKIKVSTMNGKVLATLSPVANVEALALRHQKDSLPAIKAMVFGATIRDAGIVLVADWVLGAGGFARKYTDKYMEPDTTSWMSLPATILAARFYSPKGLKKIKIRSYNSKGKKIAEQTVKLSKGNRHFVLVRSIDKTLYAYPSKKIWSPKS